MGENKRLLRLLAKAEREDAELRRQEANMRRLSRLKQKERTAMATATRIQSTYRQYSAFKRKRGHFQELERENGKGHGNEVTNERLQRACTESCEHSGAAVVPHLSLPMRSDDSSVHHSIHTRSLGADG